MQESFFLLFFSVEKMCFEFGFVTSGPDEALVISGFGYGSRPTVFTAGSAFVMPGLQKVQRLPLNLLTEVIHTNRVYTKVGVPVSVTGIAQVGVLSLVKDLYVCMYEGLPS